MAAPPQRRLSLSQLSQPVQATAGASEVERASFSSSRVRDRNSQAALTAQSSIFGSSGGTSRLTILRAPQSAEVERESPRLGPRDGQPLSPHALGPALPFGLSPSAGPALPMPRSSPILSPIKTGPASFGFQTGSATIGTGSALGLIGSPTAASASSAPITSFGPFSPSSSSFRPRAPAPMPTKPTKIYSSQQVMAELGVSAAALSAACPTFEPSPALSHLSLTDPAEGSAPMDMPVPRSPVMPRSRSDTGAGEPMDMVPLPEDILLPYADRPSELAELFALTANNVLLKLVSDTLARDTVDRETVNGDPVRWSVEAFHEHLMLPREQCADALWIARIRRCIRPRGESLYERLRATIGIEPTDADAEDDDTPIETPMDTRSGSPDITESPFAQSMSSSRITVGEVVEGEALIESERLLADVAKAPTSIELLADGPHIFTGGPIFAAEESPRARRVRMHSAGSFGSSAGARGNALSMAAIPETDSVDAADGDNEDNDEVAPLGRSVSFASLSSRGESHGLSRSTSGGLDSGAAPLSPRMVRGLRFSTTSPAFRPQRVASGGSHLSDVLNGDEFAGFSEHEYAITTDDDSMIDDAEFFPPTTSAPAHAFSFTGQAGPALPSTAAPESSTSV